MGYVLDDAQRSPGPLVLGCAMLVGVVANGFSNTLPVFLTSLGRTRGVTEAQGGLFTLAELGGLALGSLACALLPDVVERLNWRRTAAVGLSIVVVANLLMVPMLGFTFLVIFGTLAGIGSGFVNAILYAVLGESDGARSLGAFNTAQLAFAAAGMPLMSIVASRYGGGGPFAALCVLALLALPLCNFIPKRGCAPRIESEASPAAGTRISAAGWTVVAGMALYFTGSGATFGFLAYMGIAWGGDPAHVEGALSEIMIVSMIATLLATFMGSRYGYLRPLSLGVAGVLLAMAVFILVMPVQTYLLVGCIFYFCGNLAVPYLFDALTDVDGSSSAAMMMGVTQLGGLAIGPAIAGYLVTPDYRVVNGFGLVLSVAAVMLIYFAIVRHRQPGLGLPVIAD